MRFTYIVLFNESTGWSLHSSDDLLQKHSQYASSWNSGLPLALERTGATLEPVYGATASSKEVKTEGIVTN